MHLIEKVANSNDPSGRNEPFTDELFAISDVELAKKIEVSRACQASKGMVKDRHNKIHGRKIHQRREKPHNRSSENGT